MAPSSSIVVWLLEKDDDFVHAKHITGEDQGTAQAVH